MQVGSANHYCFTVCLNQFWKMKRFFGSAPKPEAGGGSNAPGGANPSLSDTSKQVETRLDDLEQRIAKCDKEIVECMQNRMGRNANLAKQKAVQIMKRKKMLEAQRDQLVGTQLNLETVAFTAENIQMTAATVNALTASTAAMEKQLKAIDPDRVADLLEDTQELMMNMEEINDMMSRNYALDGIDEAELDAEFDAIEAEIKLDNYNAMMSGGSTVPSYLPTGPISGNAVPAGASAAPVMSPTAPPMELQ